MTHGEEVEVCDGQAWHECVVAGLRGEIARVREDMLHAATELRFEDAAKMRDRLQELETLELAR